MHFLFESAALRGQVVLRLLLFLFLLLQLSIPASLLLGGFLQLLAIFLSDEDVLLQKSAEQIELLELQLF
jgi:hypothetical protein